MSYSNNNKHYVEPEPSPIEIAFWETAKPLLPGLVREAWIDDKYRVDFLLPSKNIIIELYGYKYHNSKEKITKDAARERYLQRKGYQVVRFTGTEVYKDAQKCVNEVISLTQLKPEKYLEVPSQPVIEPVNTGRNSAPPHRVYNQTAYAPSKHLVLGMKKWQIKVLGLMLITVVIMLVCLASILANLRY